jgi:hypothetical protein
MRNFFFILAFSVCFTFQNVYAQITIYEPPSGTLSDEQLALIAEDIHKILNNPLAEGSENGRLLLWQWILGSPDVTVTVCPTVIGPVAQSENEYKNLYVILSVLSSAAYLINNPDADLLDEQVSGVTGMLQAYDEVKKAVGADAEDPIMEELSRLRDDGELRSAVQRAMGG